MGRRRQGEVESGLIPLGLEIEKGTRSTPGHRKLTDKAPVHARSAFHFLVGFAQRVSVGDTTHKALPFKGTHLGIERRFQSVPTMEFDESIRGVDAQLQMQMCVRVATLLVSLHSV